MLKTATAAAALVALASPTHAAATHLPECDAHGMSPGLLSRPGVSRVCRMHGAGGGAPKGNRNALKHGEFTAEATALRREVFALAWMARETLGAIE